MNSILKKIRYDLEALKSTIRSSRPELKIQEGNERKNVPPIPQDPPKWVLNRFDTDIPNIGSMMTALQMPTYGDFDPVGWYYFLSFSFSFSVYCL